MQFCKPLMKHAEKEMDDGRTRMVSVAYHIKDQELSHMFDVEQFQERVDQLSEWHQNPKTRKK